MSTRSVDIELRLDDEHKRWACTWPVLPAPEEGGRDATLHTTLDDRWAILMAVMGALGTCLRVSSALSLVSLRPGYCVMRIDLAREPDLRVQRSGDFVAVNGRDLMSLILAAYPSARTLHPPPQ